MYVDLLPNTQKYFYPGIDEQEYSADSGTSKMLAPEASGPYDVSSATAESVTIRQDVLETQSKYAE